MGLGLVVIFVDPHWLVPVLCWTVGYVLPLVVAVGLVVVAVKVVFRIVEPCAYPFDVVPGDDDSLVWLVDDGEGDELADEEFFRLFPAAGFSE